MKIAYLKNGKTYKTTASNSDLEVNVLNNDHRYTVNVSAKSDITLVSVNNVIPFHVNFRDLYFLNGYQSWTDSHEYSLFK